MFSIISMACLDSPFGMYLMSAWSLRVTPWGLSWFTTSSTDGQLTFGSEIRAILAAEDSKPQVDPIALNLFLRFRYTPSPLTIFKGIRKLAPGTMLILENGRCREERWYNYMPVPFSGRKEEKQAAEELLELYRGAVKRHLLSDVPVGILLSGGIDSGLLLALMNDARRTMASLQRRLWQELRRRRADVMPRKRQVSWAQGI